MADDAESDGGTKGGEIIVRSAKDLENLTDAELLGKDYQAWLRRRKKEAEATLRSGLSARERAERAMKDAEQTVERAKKALDD